MAPTDFAPISDADDPRLADFRRLNDGGHCRQVEAAGPFHTGLFVAEGWLVLERLLRSGYNTRSILVVEGRIDRLDAIRGRREIPTFTASQDVVDRVVGFPLHRGVVASADRGRPLLADHVIGRASQLVLLEGINDAENMGALLRSARVLGCDGVLLDATCCDPLSRRAVRVSMGHALALPIARSPWPDDAGDVRSAGFTIHAMTPGVDAIDIDHVDRPADSRVAVALGAEGPGLSSQALAGADVAVGIPIAPDTDSLNVAAAAAIAFQRLFRAK